MTTTRRSTTVRGALTLSAAVAGAPLLVVLMAACGSTASPPPPKPVSAPSALPSGSGNPPGVVGMIASVGGTSIEVQNPTSGQVTVDFSATTRITAQRSGTLADVKPGTCLVATGTPAGGGVTARSITLTVATNGTCGGRANPFGGGGPGARPSGRPNRSPRPSASPRDAATAFGTVTGVSGGTITINGTMRSFGNGASAAPAAHPVTITVDPATRYTTDAAATASALVTGQCAAAVGTSNDIGTVTATSISVFPPTNNTCGGLFGRGGTGQAAGGGTNG